MVDYHRPESGHPLRMLMGAVFSLLEPFARDLWTHEISDFLPSKNSASVLKKETLFKGLYQLVVLSPEEAVGHAE